MPVVHRRRCARRLLQMVEDLLEVEYDWSTDAELVRRYAIAIGAHSVARAVAWVMHPGLEDYHNVDFVLHDAAERFLWRAEAL